MDPQNESDQGSDFDEEMDVNNATKVWKIINHFWFL